MIIRFLFIAFFFPLFLYWFRYSWDEGSLLFVASLIFFGTLFVRVRIFAADFFVSRLEEIYFSLADLFFARLNRLNRLFLSTVRLFSSLLVLGRLLFGFFLSLLALPASPAAVLLAASVKRRFLSRLLSLSTRERQMRLDLVSFSVSAAGLAVERELAVRFATRENN